MSLQILDCRSDISMLNTYSLVIYNQLEPLMAATQNLILAALKKNPNHVLLNLLSDSEETEPSFVIRSISSCHLSAEAPAPPLSVHLGCHQLYCCCKPVSGITSGAR